MNIKKNILISIVISVIITIICASINLLCIYTINKAPLTIETAGGECISYVGFGIEYLKVFTFSASSGGSSPYYKTSFYPESLILPLIVIFIVVFAIKTIIDMKNKKKQK